MSFAKIRPRRGTASEWSSVNPVLVEGEIGIEVPDSGVGTGTVKIKFGDGVNAWNDLPYGVTNGLGPEDLPDNLLTEDDIVNNAVTDDPVKVASASVAKNLQDQVTAINDELSGGLPVTYYYLSHSMEGHAGAYVTTTKTQYSTLVVNGINRKFSDYDYLCFELLINSNTVRASIVIPRTRFTNHKYNIELTYVDSTNTQRWVSVEYISDTSYYMQGSSNISSDTRVQISGMIALPRRLITYG